MLHDCYMLDALYMKINSYFFLIPRSHLIRYMYDKNSVKTEVTVETKKEDEKDVNASKKEN